MVHKALGCLAEEDGSNYSKARIAMLIVGMVFLGFFIWLIVLSVAINKKENSEPKVINISTTTSGIPTSTSKGSSTETSKVVNVSTTTSAIPTSTSEGSSTETPKDRCDDYGCEHGGECVLEGGEPKCNCKSGYIGKHCQMEDICKKSKPCQNGGTCTNQDDTDHPYKCECQNGFAGKNCQQESIIRAYWDKGSCGPDGDDYNAKWCDKKKGNCPPEKSTKYCEHENGYRTVFLKEQTINNCTYNYYAEYTCQGNNASEIIGEWKMKKDENEILITCEKSDKKENIYHCESSEESSSSLSMDIEWKNKIYHVVQNNEQEITGAITNNKLTWNLILGDKMQSWERKEKPYCINIVTGNTKWDAGVLTLSINNIEKVSSQTFEKGEQVINECFSSFDSITVQNPDGNAWSGEIQVTKIGSQEDLSLFCSEGCENSQFDGKIAVDGNADSKCPGVTCCLNGNYCTIKEKKSYYVDDACQSDAESDDSSDLKGAFESETSFEAFVSCCSEDGTSCKIISDCKIKVDKVSFAEAEAKCSDEEMRLCKKNEILNDVCCNSGRKCDNVPIWTSTSKEEAIEENLALLSSIEKDETERDNVQDNESIIRAYWDPKSCGPDGPNYNKNWCNNVTGVCPLEISTELCKHGSAYRTKNFLNKTINDCTYRFFAEYTCQGTDANEIIGKWKAIDAKESILITCEKSDVSNNDFKCTHGNDSVDIKWSINKVYYMLDEKQQPSSGAIANDVFTWSFCENTPWFVCSKNKWVFWERVE